MSDRRPLRIVHTSDVHLGAYGGSTSVKGGNNEMLQEGFARVIDLAINQEADALLIAGDFFDNGRVKQDTVDEACETIDRFPGNTILLPGNHDPMDDEGLYWRFDLEAQADRLTIIREHMGEYVEIDGLDLVIWGRGYRDSDFHFKPLEGLPKRKDDRWHIAMAHGHFVRDGYDLQRSMLMHPEEIGAGQGHWDYMAFGHWEPHTDVSVDGVTAVYSGAPMALSGSGRNSGFAVVADFDDDGVQWEPHPVDPRAVPNER
jgi:DNA repair exonuclease SbcCD nuclease subunit